MVDQAESGAETRKETIPTAGTKVDSIVVIGDNIDPVAVGIAPATDYYEQ